MLIRRDGARLSRERDGGAAREIRSQRDYGVVYSTIAVTWGRKPAGGFNWTDAAWSSAWKK